MLRQPFGDDLGVARLPLHTQAEGLDSLTDEEGVERGG
jgi:hypothetical protein